MLDINNQPTISLWEINAAIRIKINCATYVNVKEAGKVGWCQFHYKCRLKICCWKGWIETRPIKLLYMYMCMILVDLLRNDLLCRFMWKLVSITERKLCVRRRSPRKWSPTTRDGTSGWSSSTWWTSHAAPGSVCPSAPSTAGVTGRSEFFPLSQWTVNCFYKSVKQLWMAKKKVFSLRHTKYLTYFCVYYCRGFN